MEPLRVYRCWVDGLSFERRGPAVAAIVPPDGSTLERCSGLFGTMATVLMVPDQGEPGIRYAWTASDAVVEGGNDSSRFRLVDLGDLDMLGLTPHPIGAN